MSRNIQLNNKGSIIVINVNKFLYFAFVTVFFIIYIIKGILIYPPIRAEYIGLLRNGSDFDKYVQIDDGLLVWNNQSLYFSNPAGQMRYINLPDNTTADDLIPGKAKKNMFIINKSYIMEYSSGQLNVIHTENNAEIIDFYPNGGKIAMLIEKNGEILAKILTRSDGSIIVLKNDSENFILSSTWANSNDSLIIGSLSLETSYPTGILNGYSNESMPDYSIRIDNFLINSIQILNDTILFIGRDRILCYNHEGEMIDSIEFLKGLDYKYIKSGSDIIYIFEKPAILTSNIIVRGNDGFTFYDADPNIFSAEKWKNYLLGFNDKSLLFYDMNFNLKQRIPLEHNIKSVFFTKHTNYINVVDDKGNLYNYYMEN